MGSLSDLKDDLNRLLGQVKRLDPATEPPADIAAGLEVCIRDSVHYLFPNTRARSLADLYLQNGMGASIAGAEFLIETVIAHLPSGGGGSGGTASPQFRVLESEPDLRWHTKQENRTQRELMHSWHEFAG
jgi:hypothetical protein